VSAGALADVRILDFMWVMAGPAATRMLADYGAEIVRVESTQYVDTARTLAPFHRAERRGRPARVPGGRVSAA